MIPLRPQAARGLPRSIQRPCRRVLRHGRFPVQGKGRPKKGGPDF